MQSMDIILPDEAIGLSRSVGCATSATLCAIFAMTPGILPASASETPRSQQAGSLASANGRGVAVASARVLKPFSMQSTVRTANGMDDYDTSVSRRSSFRDCSVLLGLEANSGTAETCELRLTELQ
jgi:hypothetical protein